MPSAEGFLSRDIELTPSKTDHGYSRPCTVDRHCPHQHAFPMGLQEAGEREEGFDPARCLLRSRWGRWESRDNVGKLSADLPSVSSCRP